MPTIQYALNGYVFEWDSDKHEQVMRKHQLEFEEACSVFFDPNELTFQDNRFHDTEQRYITIGMSNQARLLVVAWTQRSNIRLITVIKAEKKHERKYRKLF